MLKGLIDDFLGDRNTDRSYSNLFLWWRMQNYSPVIIVVESLALEIDFIVVRDLRIFKIVVRKVLFFGPEKYLKKFKSRVGVAPKRRFWS